MRRLYEYLLLIFRIFVNESSGHNRVFATDVLEGGIRTVWARLATERMSEIQVELSFFESKRFFTREASSLIFDRNNWNLRQPIQIIGGSGF